MKTSEFIIKSDIKENAATDWISKQGKNVGNWLLRHGVFGKTKAILATAQYQEQLAKKVGFREFATKLKQLWDGAVNSGEVVLESRNFSTKLNYKRFNTLLENLINEANGLDPATWIKEYVSRYYESLRLPSNFQTVLDQLADNFSREIKTNPKMDFNDETKSIKKLYDFLYGISASQPRDERKRVIPAAPATTTTPATPTSTRRPLVPSKRRKVGGI